MANDRVAQVAHELAEVGWSVCVDFLPAELVGVLADEARGFWREGDFRRAGVGRGASWKLQPEVRSDHVHWLEEATLTPAQRRYWDELERLRLALNQTLTLGLFGFEGHLTTYPPGAFYRRHLDQFQGAAHRIVSAILYLNQDWRASDGGQLRLYLDPAGEVWKDVVPTAGTLVCFLSDTFYHEVLPAQRERMSLTGWFRRRE